jgi:hypothetical protein
MMVEQAAVINADRVVVSSEKAKDVYYKRAIELCGAETEMYWQQKIVTMDEYISGGADGGNGEALTVFVAERSRGAITGERNSEEWKSLVGDTRNKKVILYYISMSFILQYKEQALDKISRAFDTFSDAGDDILAVVEPQEAVLTQLNDIDESLASRFSELLAEAKGASNIIVDRNGVAVSHVDKCAAFYGDRGAIQKRFAETGIPVMIQNVDV